MITEDFHNFTKEEFSKLIEEKLQSQPKESSIVKGKITGILDGVFFVDVGLKSEGRIPITQFQGKDLKIGDEIDVYIDRIEGRNGCTQLSRDKVAKEMAWNRFEELVASDSSVLGKIIGKVNRGGFAVEIEGILAFLPGSQLDVRPVKDISPLLNVEQPFKILKIDREQGNVVVSRRAILEKSRKEARNELLSGIKDGMKFKGTIKNITDYGAFIDLGDIDGLLHITDISWDKISHPSEKLTLGEEIEVVVIKYNEETQRVSLGLKQLTDNPWNGLEKTYAIGTKHKGKVVSIFDYGVFVELEKSIEGLVYLNEIDWNIKNTHPTKLIQVGDEVEVKVLDIEINKHKISLSIKQCSENPWKIFVQQYPVGAVVNARIRKIVDFGLFVNIIEGSQKSNLDVLVPAIEISHGDNPKDELKNFKVGDEVKGVVISSDLERERVTISIKKLKENDFQKIVQELIKLKVATCKVLEVTQDGLFVEVSPEVNGFIKKFDLSKHKDQQKPERFTVNDRIDAKIISYDKDKKVLNLSVKVLEIDEEKKAIAEYGSVYSGASLGDILGAAIEQQDKDNKDTKT